MRERCRALAELVALDDKAGVWYEMGTCHVLDAIYVPCRLDTPTLGG